MSTFRKLALNALAVGLVVPAGAWAACSGTQVKHDSPGAGLATLLKGNTVCESNGAGGWKHQELHQADGALVDYKRGPGDPVDPSATVGSWAVVDTGANTVVRYTYGSTSYDHKVYEIVGTSYSFCLGSTERLVTLKSGSGGCP